MTYWNRARENRVLDRALARYQRRERLYAKAREQGLVVLPHPTNVRSWRGEQRVVRKETHILGSELMPLVRQARDLAGRLEELVYGKGR